MVQAVHGGSPGGRSETIGGRICEKGRF